MGEWFYQKNGGSFGPVETETLKQLAVEGTLKPSDLIWREGLPEWVPASKTKGLFPTPAGAISPDPKLTGPPPLPTNRQARATWIKLIAAGAGGVLFGMALIAVWSSFYERRRPPVQSPVVTNSPPPAQDTLAPQAPAATVLDDVSRGEALMRGSNNPAMDKAGGIALLSNAANGGSVRADRDLGDAYLAGDGVTKSESTAAEYFRKAAELGDAESQRQLGVLYLDGSGVAKNEATALSWLEKSANQGDPLAEGSLGWMYKNGQGVEQNDAEAVSWFRKAADQGLIQAETDLAEMYSAGRGVQKDDAAAAQWYGKAAAQGDLTAEEKLGLYYLSGLGVAQDESQGIALERKASEGGDGQATTILAQCYWKGIGVTADADQALRLFLDAAGHDNSEAMDNLGLLYLDGDGVQKDASQAAEWFRKSAEAGFPAAEDNWGMMLEFGRGVGQDEQQARAWFEKAADQGLKSATDHLADLRSSARQLLDDGINDMRLYGVRFDEVISWHSGENKILIDWKSLESAGLTRDVRVTANCEGVSLAEALNRLLASAGGAHASLAYTIDHGVIVISTEAEVNKTYQ